MQRPGCVSIHWPNHLHPHQAKVGNYPFTTIEPNTGVTFYRAPCPCLSHGKVKECSPRYGRCVEGTRFIPVKLLDVAGLVPGASEGAGLGNKFLDDLRHADVLMHILDVSGTTNEKGEATVGYDPINDAQWLHSEIHGMVCARVVVSRLGRAPGPGLTPLRILMHDMT